MDQRQSYCLAYRQDDFSGPAKGAHNPGAYEILYIAPANDNSPNGYYRSLFAWAVVVRCLLRHTRRRRDSARL
jgi:hypothetical protein